VEDAERPEPWVSLGEEKSPEGATQDVVPASTESQNSVSPAPQARGTGFWHTLVKPLRALTTEPAAPKILCRGASCGAELLKERAVSW